MVELQRTEHLPRIYSQISGQAWFLLHANDGRYRRPFIETLIAIYTNKSDDGTLANLCRRRFEELDAEYQIFMRTVDSER
jgi:hypothetical protein